MIQSMTGFGKVIAEMTDKKVTIEIKSLNSKQLDLFTRIPSAYREKEMQIRNELSQKLERGKIDFILHVEYIGKDTSTKINAAVVEGYYEQIRDLAGRLSVSLPDDWFPTLLRLPDVIKNETVEVDEAEWQKVYQAIADALAHLIEFRQQEGRMLQKLFEQKIATIGELLKEVEPYEQDRIDKIKGRLLENLQKVPEVEYDKNRFEQELIYYLEKLDINEEKDRLRNHLHYFIDTMNNGSGQGKKLGFIVQEIGREINTLGSKSNHAEMQQIVVQMKDVLEQIKEQVLNVL
ncbi:YicC/YloC family endoribonuclease [Tannerella forsythia]|uniref:YicC/YloC family endoribonuclease n=1 Tax=Tannerella forsythia TaxID=28112 RepID=UPI000618B9DE|nr:YicC/YloC family endoribonuclease [Tannerella forsythia]BAR48187.1 hypothetical protein TF3313_0611 [Tannerella forsythia 3313]